MFRNIFEFNKIKKVFLFSFIIISQCLYSLCQSPTTYIKYGNGYNANGNIDGSLKVGDSLEENVFSFNLKNFRLMAKKKNEENFVEVEGTYFDFSKQKWAFVNEEKQTISLKQNKITVSTSGTNDSTKLQINIKNENEYSATKEKEYEGAIFQYEYNFKYTSARELEYQVNTDTFTRYTSLFEYIEFSKLSKFEKNTFQINYDQNPQFIYFINDIASKNTLKLSKEDINIESTAKGGKLNLDQPTIGNYPKNMIMMLNDIYEFNDKNEINGKKLGLLSENTRVQEDLNLNVNEDDIKFNTFFFGNKTNNITQSINIQTSESILSIGQMKEKFIDKESKFILEENPIINKGDILVSYEFNNYPFCFEGNKDKNLCENFNSENIEMAIKFNFPDIKYEENKNINGGKFYLYAFMTGKDENSKIISMKLNDQDDPYSNSLQNNYLKIRLTPPKDNLKLGIFIRFSDPEDRLRVLSKEEISSTSQRIIKFRNQEYFSIEENYWPEDKIEEITSFFKNFILTGIEELQNEEKIRSYEFFNSLVSKVENLNKTKNNKFLITTEFIEEGIYMNILIQEGKKDETNIQHEYIDKDGKKINEEIELEDKQFYVKFSLNKWIPCKKTDYNFTNPCKANESNKLRITYLIQEIIMFFKNPDLKKTPKVILTPLKGNDLNNNIKENNDVEKYLIFDFDPNMENDLKNAAFKVKFTSDENENGKTKGGLSPVVISIIVILAILVVLIAGILYRKLKIKRLSGESERLNV